MEHNTHDPHGLGNPRLVIAQGDTGHVDPVVFALGRGTNTIGSADTAVVRLDGLEPEHAQVCCSTDDEYVYECVTEAAVPSLVNGQAVHDHQLHNGDRLQLGRWALIFQREESADHGRPDHGRTGPQRRQERLQGRPRSRGATEAGGSDVTDTDPGEYY